MRPIANSTDRNTVACVCVALGLGKPAGLQRRHTAMPGGRAMPHRMHRSDRGTSRSYALEGR
jgi:hypothetical protein